MSVTTWSQATTDRDTGILFAAYIQFQPVDDVVQCAPPAPSYVELTLQTAHGGRRGFRLTSAAGFTPFVAMPREGVVSLRAVKFCQRATSTAPLHAHSVDGNRAALVREDTFLSIRRAYTIPPEKSLADGYETFVTLHGCTPKSAAASTFETRLSFMAYPKTTRSSHMRNVRRAFRVAIYFETPLALLPSLERRAHSLVALLPEAFQSYRIAFKRTPWPTQHATTTTTTNLDDVDIDIGASAAADDDVVADNDDDALRRLVVGVIPGDDASTQHVALDASTRSADASWPPPLEHWHFRLVADFYDMTAHARDDIGASETDIASMSEGSGGAPPFATFALPLEHCATTTALPRTADASSLDDALHALRVTFKPLVLPTPLAIPQIGRATFRLERRYCTCATPLDGGAAHNAQWITAVAVRRVDYNTTSALSTLWQHIGKNYVTVNGDSRLWALALWVAPPHAPPTGVDETPLVDLDRVAVTVHLHYTLAANEADRPLFSIESYAHYGDK